MGSTRSCEGRISYKKAPIVLVLLALRVLCLDDCTVTISPDDAERQPG